MNNNDTKKQKGFSMALYVCLGVMLIGGAMLAAYLTGDTNEAVPVAAMGTATPMPMPAAPTAPAPRPAPAPLPARPVTPAPQAVPAPGQAAINEFFNIGEEGAVQAQAPQSTEVVTEAPEPVAAVPVFNHFVEGTTMSWPVVGEIVMDYSSDAFVFDPTLHSYRLNDTMRIAAAQGTTVRAVAEGVVQNINYDRRYGTILTIDHGNGWETTYSQLGDIVVSPGDVVATGQIIAEVGSHGIFSSALGDNLGFSVSHNESSVNPLSVLAQ